MEKKKPNKNNKGLLKREALKFTKIRNARL